MRRADASDVAVLAQVLARAFRDDPVHRWILPSEFDWAVSSPRFFRMVLGDALRHHEVFTTVHHEGAALWFPPYAQVAPPLRRFGMALTWFRMTGRRGARLGLALDRVEKLRPTQPHWYLAILGTDPRHQGKGVGSELLREALARCDADGTPAYLESSKQANLPFYEKHGFAVAEVVDLPDGPREWCMWREPRS